MLSQIERNLAEFRAQMEVAKAGLVGLTSEGGSDVNPNSAEDAPAVVPETVAELRYLDLETSASFSPDTSITTTSVVTVEAGDLVPNHAAMRFQFGYLNPPAEVSEESSVAPDHADALAFVVAPKGVTVGLQLSAELNTRLEAYMASLPPKSSSKKSIAAEALASYLTSRGF